MFPARLPQRKLLLQTALPSKIVQETHERPARSAAPQRSRTAATAGGSRGPAIDRQTAEGAEPKRRAHRTRQSAANARSGHGLTNVHPPRIYANSRGSRIN